MHELALEERGVLNSWVSFKRGFTVFLADEDDVSQVTSEELSAFYKDFLDKKYHDQMIFTK